MPLDNFILW